MSGVRSKKQTKSGYEILKLDDLDRLRSTDGTLLLLGEETFDAPTGTLVHAVPGRFRSATAAEPGTIVLACGAEAGKAFTPSGWEDFYVAFALLRDGETERARATMHEALAREPDAWQGQYNAACFEALAGEADDAFDHLQRAIAMNREVVEYAAADDDLASLRADPRYAEVVR